MCMNIRKHLDVNVEELAEEIVDGILNDGLKMDLENWENFPNEV